MCSSVAYSMVRLGGLAVIASRVFAMARPRLAPSEATAIRLLATRLPPRLSCRRKADELARQVVAAFLADLARVDPFERALFDAQHTLAPDPLHDLATSEALGLSAWFTRERLARFEARGCRQLTDEQWQAETLQLASAARQRLARRFRGYLKNLAVNGFLGQSDGAACPQP